MEKPRLVLAEILVLQDWREVTGEIEQVSASRGGGSETPAFTWGDHDAGTGGRRLRASPDHGGPLQRILLLAVESVEILKSQGFAVFPGALGENLTTRGLDPRLWRAGQIWLAGGVRLELTKLRTPCKTIKVYGREIDRFVYDELARAGDVESPVWGFSGFYASVLSEGVVKPGDAITLWR